MLISIAGTKTPMKKNLGKNHLRIFYVKNVNNLYVARYSAKLFSLVKKFPYFLFEQRQKKSPKQTQHVSKTRGVVKKKSNKTKNAH